MATPTLSILVPSFNRANILALVWPSWLKQEGLTDIVIVNDGSTQDYQPVLSAIGDACRARDIRFKVIYLPVRSGAPVARNAGLSQCLGEEILTVDDDILLNEDMVAMCRRHRPGGGKVICGPRVIYLRENENLAEGLLRAESGADAPYMDHNRLILKTWAGKGSSLQVPFITAVVLWPRSLFDEGLRYYEHYGGNGFREETDPQIAAQHHFGATVHLIPSAVCFHLPLKLAYAEHSGQRRRGHIWYEYWALRNNARFWKRHRVFMEQEWGISSLRSQFLFAIFRLRPQRWINWVRRIASRQISGC